MFKKFILSLIVFTLYSLGTINAQNNDLCSDAISISCDEAISGTTIGATFDDVGFCGTGNTAPGVWFVFEGQDDFVTFGTCTADYDSKISVFSGPLSCDNLDCVDGDDDSCTGLTSEVSIYGDLGMTYYILVHGFSTNTGDFELSVTCGVEDIYGCMDATATNYNQEANIDDGSCDYLCSEGQIAATLYVCTFSNAEEVALEIIDENGDIVFEQEGFSGQPIMTIELCIEEGMCYTVNMINTVNTGWYNGYYWINIDGNQVSTGFPEDDESFASNEFSTNGPCGELIYGCLNENACNFNSNANMEDQSCTYPGCTDEEAFNFDVFAGCDDESCIYIDPVGNDFCSTSIPISCGEIIYGTTIGATIDNVSYCGTNITAPGVWYVFEGTDEGVTFGTCTADYDTKLSIFSSDDDCSTLECIDGDDDSCTGFTSEVSIYGELGTSYYIFVHGFSSNVGNFDLTVSCGEFDIFGCTNSNASNYNAEATVDDGSCEYPCEGVAATLYVCTFANGNEVSIEILDGEGNIVFAQDDFSNNQIMNTELCLEDDVCYTVNMYNTVNTGWYGGYFWLNIGGVQVATGFPADDVDFATLDFSTYGPCGDVSLGCTDDNACNFDSTANWDDQSCTYPGCTDPEAFNYNAFAGCDDDSCFYVDPSENDVCSDAISLECDQTVAGTTIGASAYAENPCGNTNSLGIWYTFANIAGEVTLSTCGQADYDTRIIVFSSEGGSCDDLVCEGNNDDYSGCSGFTSQLTINSNGGTYFVYVAGFSANQGNFELTMTCNDEVQDVYGCMDSTALNYNTAATIDDNSCIYGPAIENDDCNNAISMECGETVVGATINATIDVTFGCNTAISAPGVWYTIIGDDSNITLSTCDQADFDTKINVYQGECDSIMTCIGNNDDYTGCSGFTSQLSFFGNADETYYILVHGFGSNTGVFSLSATCGDETENYGCMDLIALNYDSTATVDDGSCVYFQEDCEALFAIYDIINEEDLVMVANLSAGANLSYFWDFGDGSTSTDDFPIHFYEEDGTYTVCLTITGDDDCEDTYCMDISYEGAGDIIEGAEINSGTNSGFSINVVDIVSVDENEIQVQDLTIYPNPVSDQLTIEFKQQTTDESTYQVLDLAGRVILTQTILTNNKSTTIDVNTLSNGIYLLSITNEFGIVTKRFEVTK